MKRPKTRKLNFQLMQARELQLRTRRDEIERSLKNLEGTVERGENLINQISLAISLLKRRYCGNITAVQQ
jgi:two-component system sensor histidine kinase DegS